MTKGVITMNKKNRLLLIVVVVALMLGIAVTATAGPDFCDEESPKYNPNHPSCSTTTTTTTPTQPPQLEPCETNMTITGKGNVGHDCLWTPIFDDSTTVATVTVSDIEGGIKKPPVVFVRDDAPGDICALEQDWGSQDGPPYVAEFKLVYDTVPEGYEVDYGAWFGRSYWDFVYNDAPTEPVVGAYWCAPQDPVLDSLRLDTNGTPLHLSVSFSARGGGQAVITLFPAQEQPIP